MDPELYRQLGATLLRNKVLAHIDIHPYNIDLFNEVEEGSLLIVNERTANSLVDVMVHAITAGSLKMVGVLFIIDAEAFASTPTLLNLAICSFWAVGLIVVKPRTDRMNFSRFEGGGIPASSLRWGPSSSLRGATGCWPFTRAGQ